MKNILLALLFSTSAYAFDFQKHKITLVNDIDEKHLDEFIIEFNKFPKNLMAEMVKQNARIDLINGQGVTDHPIWKSKLSTWDNRGWQHIPGSGGSPYANIQTIIVVNRLYEGHGSKNLFLHEHGHALDSTYENHGISDGKAWQKLVTRPEVMSYMSQTCGDYCKNTRESFAESFARYYDSVESRADMEVDAPELAKFFNNLTSVRKASGT
jgi:hypothetical protein